MVTMPIILLFCETQRLTDQKLSSSIFPCRLFVCPASVTSPLYDVLGHTNHIFSESCWSKDIKTDITKCLMHKYKNTNTQIHKYSILRSARKTQKRIVQGEPKIIFTCVKRANTKIKIHKYTNTAYDEVPERPNMWYIFEKRI